MCSEEICDPSCRGTTPSSVEQLRVWSGPTNPFRGPAAKGKLTRLSKARLKSQKSWGRSLRDPVCAPGGDWLLVQTQGFSFLQRQHIPALCMFLPAGSAGIAGAGWVFKGSDIFWEVGESAAGKVVPGSL